MTTGTTGVQQMCWQSNRRDRTAGHQCLGFRLRDDATLAAWSRFFAAWSASSADVLRTTFGEERGTVVAHVHDEPQESLINVGRFDSEEEARHRILEIATSGLSDLNSLPLLKNFVATLNGGGHLVVVVSEHIVHDGAMIGLAIAGVAATRKQGEMPSEFARAPTYQGDYLAAEQQLVRSAQGTQRMRFWERLIGDVEPLSICGADVREAPPNGALETIREVSIPDTPLWNQSTPFDQLAAGMAILVLPWLAGDDVVLNMPWSRRSSNPQFRLVAGNLTEYLPIRVRVDPALSFDELVTQIAESRKQARANYLPLTYILHGLGLSWLADPTPFLQVMINAMPSVAAPVLLHPVDDTIELTDGIMVRPLLPIGRAFERQDLSILVTRYPGVLRWRFGARTDVLPADLRADCDRRLLSIIEHAISDPGAKITHINDRLSERKNC
jgi:hypothetical protein